MGAAELKFATQRLELAIEAKFSIEIRPRCEESLSSLVCRNRLSLRFISCSTK